MRVEDEALGLGFFLGAGHTFTHMYIYIYIYSRSWAVADLLVDVDHYVRQRPATVFGLQGVGSTLVRPVSCHCKVDIFLPRTHDVNLTADLLVDVDHDVRQRPAEREVFIVNLIVRIHLIIEMVLVDRPCARHRGLTLRV